MADAAAVDALAAQIATLESGGQGDPYAAMGPATHSGDRAIGKYQIMGANVPSWSTEALGTSMSPEDFAKNPDAQEKVAKHRLGKYLDQYGNPKDAASMWHAGVPYDKAVAEKRKDGLGTTTQSYADRVAGGLADSTALGNTPTAAEAAADDTSPLPDVPLTGRESLLEGAHPQAADVKVRLPDNTVINLGPNPTPALREQIKAKIAAKFPTLTNNQQTATTTTPDSGSAATVAPGTKDLRDLTPEEVGRHLNTQFGLPDNHFIGKYTALVGKPGADALHDLYDVISSGSASNMSEGMDHALKLIEPLGVPGHIAGDVAAQALQDMGAPPEVQAVVGTLMAMFVGAKTPLPLRGVGALTGTLTREMPLQGTKALKAAAQEAMDVASRGTEWAGAAKTAGTAATDAAAADAVAATTAAESAAAKVLPSTEAKAAADAALVPAGVTPEAGGAAVQSGLASDLASVKDPVQGIYQAVEANATNAAKTVDPGKYKAIAEQLAATKAELGPTLTGQAKSIIDDLESKITTGQRLTFADLAPYKEQLDTLFPGRTPLGATPRTAALYQFKWDVRQLMSGMLGGEDKAWFDTANAMWRDQVLPKEKLVALVKKADPVTVVERLFGNGTSAKQSAVARTVLKALKDTPQGDAVHQAIFARLIGKASTADGVMDPADLLKAYDGFAPEFRAALDHANPGAKTFFTTVRQQLADATNAAAQAKGATKAAETTAKSAAAATTQAEKLAAGAATDAESAKAAATAPNNLATLTAHGLKFAAIEGVLKAAGLSPAIGAMGFAMPVNRLASILANSKTANMVARALKTPRHSAVVPVILQQLQKAGVIPPTAHEAPS